MSLLSGPLVRLGVELEPFAGTILRDYRRQRNVHHLDAAKTEDALSYLIATVWELSYLYDPPGFGAAQALKRRMRSLAGTAADEKRPLQRLADVEENLRAGNRAFELTLRKRLPGPDAHECWELARLYPRYRRWLVSEKRLREVPDYGLDFQAQVRALDLECKPLDMSFSTYAYRIGLRRVTDWFRSWGGDARYGQDVKPDSLEQIQARDAANGTAREPGTASDLVEERRDVEVLRAGLTVISPQQLSRREHRQTLRFIMPRIALGIRVGELHEEHPYWNAKDINRRVKELRVEFERLGVRPSVRPSEEAVAA